MLIAGETKILIEFNDRDEIEGRYLGGCGYGETMIAIEPKWAVGTIYYIPIYTIRAIVEYQSENNS